MEVFLHVYGEFVSFFVSILTEKKCKTEHNSYDSLVCSEENISVFLSYCSEFY